MNNASIKNKLRKDMRAIRQAMDIREIDEKSEIICGRILSSEEYKNADIILAYMSAGGEVDLQVLIDAASSVGKSLFIPKVISKEEMRFYKYTGDFTKGSFGIKEPVNTSQEMLFDINKASAENKRILVLVPGVAFDVSGNRMGYGGGYYDRFLMDIDDSLYSVSRGETLVTKVGVGYDYQIVDEIPVEKYDVRMDMIVSEARIIIPSMVQ